MGSRIINPDFFRIALQEQRFQRVSQGTEVCGRHLRN
jgi:hypothetical protein